MHTIVAGHFSDGIVVCASYTSFKSEPSEDPRRRYTGRLSEVTSRMSAPGFRLDAAETKNTRRPMTSWSWTSFCDHDFTFEASSRPHAFLSLLQLEYLMYCPIRLEGWTWPVNSYLLVTVGFVDFITPMILAPESVPSPSGISWESICILSTV